MPRGSALADAGASAARSATRASDGASASVARRARALLELVRWPNALLAAAGVALGAWWAAGAATRATALAGLAAAGLAALANAYNDLRDRAIDVVAHPRRPLPSGRATEADAAGVAAAGGAVALVASTLVSPALGAATAAIAAIMFGYSAWLKARGLAGNIVVALIASLPFVYGAWSVGAPARAGLLYALAVPLHLARELAKDLDDARADAAAGRRTLPVAVGPAVTRRLLVGASIVFVCVTTATFVRGGVVAVALVTPALVCCAAGAVRADSGRAGAPRLLKAAMLLAMTAALAARAGRLL